MRRAPMIATALSLAALSACAQDETLSAYANAGAEYRLVEVNGDPFEARATMGFPEAGRVAGQAPCNSYSGALTVPYPWFATSPMAVTRMACPDLAAESAFFQVLGRMTLAEAAGDTLILSNEAGEEMVFRTP